MMMEEEGTVSCILCAANLPQRALALRLDPASVLSFTKLLRGSESNPDVPPLFSHSPYLLFCFNCHAKIHEIHEVFEKLEILRAQLALIRVDVEGELLRADEAGGTKARNRSAALRKRIVRELSLDCGTYEFTPSSNEENDLEFKVEAYEEDQDDRLFPELAELVDGEFYEPTDAWEPDGDEFDLADSLSGVELKEIDPLHDEIPELHPEEPAPSLLNFTVRQPRKAIVLKPCRVNLGRRIDDPPKTRPRKRTYKILPSRCPHPGCTSKLQFKSRVQFNRHMKIHAPKENRPTIRFSIDPSPIQTSSYDLLKQKVSSVKFPTKCPRRDCISQKLFVRKVQLQRHLKEVHFKELKPLTVDPSLDDRLNSFVYPTQCFKPNCHREIPFASKNELRRHMREAHFIRSRPPLYVDPVINETKHIQCPTMCIRPDCSSKKLYETKAQLRRHLRHVHKLRHGALYSNEDEEQEINLSDLKDVTIQVSDPLDDAVPVPKRLPTKRKPRSSFIARRKRKRRSRKDGVMKKPIKRAKLELVKREVSDKPSEESEDNVVHDNSEIPPVAPPVTESLPTTRLRPKKRPATYAESEDEDTVKPKPKTKNESDDEDARLSDANSSDDEEAAGFRCSRPKCMSRGYVFSSEIKLRGHMRHSHGVMRRPESWKKFHQRCQIPGCTSKVVFTKGFMFRRHMLTHERQEQRLQSNPLWAEIKGQEYPTKCTRENCTSQKTFHDRVTFRRHLLNVHVLKEGPIPFVIQEDLDAELSALTYPTKCHKPDCTSKLVFALKRNLRHHIKTMHQIISRQPRWLDEVTNELKGVTYPTRCVRAGCPTERIYYLPRLLRKHLKEYHNVNKKVPEPVVKNMGQMCHICGHTFHSVLSLRHHERSHDKTKSVYCEHCGAGFKSKNGLKTHMDTIHTTVPPVFLCSQCPKTFKLKHRLDIHMKRHAGVKNFYCRVCPKGYMFRIDVDEHEKFVHWEELGLEQTKCPVCQKVYSKMGTMRTHLKTHTGEQRYACTQCEYKTDYKNDYKEHIDTVHQEGFPHECTMCDKKFKLERRLRQHLLEHEDEYPNACELCDKRFATPRTLRIHNERKHGALPSDKDNLQGIIAEFAV